MFLSTALVLLVSNLLPIFVEAQPDQLEFSQGNDVTLSCSPNLSHRGFPLMLDDFDCNGGAIRWQTNDKGVISNCLSVYANNRFTVDYSGNKYNLHISNVQPSDAGQYRCYTYTYSIEDARTVQLNVQVDEPSCSANPQTVTVGDYVSLVCSLQISRALQWVSPSGTVVSSRLSESNPVQPLVFNFTAREKHNFQTFICEAISESGTYNPSCSVTPLEYTFITISPQIPRVKQGDNVMCNCDARLGPLGPHGYHYIWLRDDNIVQQGLNMSSYSFNDVRLCDNGTRVRCKAYINGREEMESSEAIIYVDSVTGLRTPNPEDEVTGLRTPNPEDEELTNTPSIEFSLNTLTKYVLAGLVTSFSVNVALVMLVVYLVKSRKARNNAENLPTGGLQMTYIDLQQRDGTTPEYETRRVESDAYEAVGLDVEYEVPLTDTMVNPVDNAPVYDYALPNA